MPPCVAPTTQPTALTFPTVSSGTMIGSFTAAAAPGASGYLVLQTPGGTAPSVAPSNGTSYTAGTALGNATVMSSGTGTTFTANNLAASTNYRFTVYAFNNVLCSGGSAYNVTSPLNTPEQQTSGPVTITANAGAGSWKNPATWSPAVVPSRNDFVFIPSSATVTIDTAAVDSSLTVIGNLTYDATTAYSLTSGGDISVKN